MDCPLLRFKNGFRRSCHTEAPVWTTIRDLVNKFQRAGNVCDEIRSGRTSISGNWGDHTTGDQAESKSDDTSFQSGTRHPQVCVWQTLSFVLKKKAIQIQVLHYLEPEDYAGCMTMCHNLNESVHVHRGEMVTLLGYGGQSCRTAVISLNYGVFSGADSEGGPGGPGPPCQIIRQLLSLVVLCLRTSCAHFSLSCNNYVAFYKFIYFLLFFFHCRVSFL